MEKRQRLQKSLLSPLKMGKYLSIMTNEIMLNVKRTELLQGRANVYLLHRGLENVVIKMSLSGKCRRTDGSQL